MILIQIAYLTASKYKQIIQKESNESYNDTKHELMIKIKNTIEHIEAKLEEQTLKIQHCREKISEREANSNTNDKTMFRKTQDNICDNAFKDLASNFKKALELQEVACGLLSLKIKLQTNLRNHNLKNLKRAIKRSSKKIK